MWLTLARDSASADEAWIKESYNQAIANVSENGHAIDAQLLAHCAQPSQAGRLTGVGGRHTASFCRRAGLGTSAAVGMTLKSPASTSGSSVFSRCREYSRRRDIHFFFFQAEDGIRDA